MEKKVVLIKHAFDSLGNMGAYFKPEATTELKRPSWNAIWGKRRRRRRITKNLGPLQRPSISVFASTKPLSRDRYFLVP